MRRSLADVNKAIVKHAGADAIVLLEQPMSKNKAERIRGQIVTQLFWGKNNVQRWGLVSDWLDEEDIDQSVIGLLQLSTPAEYDKKRKKKV